MQPDKILAIGITIGILYVIFSKYKSPGKVKLSKPRVRGPLPDITPIDNDRIIIIEQASPEEIRTSVMEFCDLYNKERHKCITKLTIIDETHMAFTFPESIELETFFFLVNFLSPVKPGHVTGWTTVRNNELKKNLAGKQIMVFVPIDDKEGDNVYFTSEDGIGYKYGFSIGDKKVLNSPLKTYSPRAFDIRTISDMAGEIMY